MRALVVVAVISCGSSPDECTQVKDKVRPLIEEMARDAGKALSDDKREELVAEFCVAKDSSESERKMYRCLVAEALRALSVASGAALAPGDCKSTKLASPKIDDLRLVAIATVGDKRAAAFDRKGEIVIATTDGAIDIGATYVTVGQQSVALYPPTRDWSPPLVATWRRTAALLHTKDGWTAFVETDSGYWFVDAKIPREPRATVDERGVHADNRDFPLGR